MIADEMGTQVCSIYLLDPDRTALRLTASRGLDRAALGKVTLGPGEGLTGTVVQEMRSLVRSILDVPLPVIVMLVPAVSVSSFVAMAVLYAEASTYHASAVFRAAVVA